jgi:hypothetical protein
MRKFTAEEDLFLRENYLTMPAKRMAAALGRAECTARQRLKVLGITIPAEVAEAFKRQFQIKKGSVPQNKGKKQADYMNAESIARAKATCFKKGNLPHNTKSDMEISIRPDRRGINYKFIRVGLGEWVPLQRYVWESANGIIQKGMKVVFKDGNTMNCNLDNLEILSCADLMKKNSVHNLPKPIAQLVQLRGALNRKINNRIKRIKNEE